MRPIVSRPLRNSSNPNGDHHAQPYPPILPVKSEGSGSGKAGFSITFVHLGRKFYQMMLSAATHAYHHKWIENITRQQDLMRERSQFFEMNIPLGGLFPVCEPSELRCPVQWVNVLDVELVDGLTQSRWGTESTVWDVQRDLLPGPAGAESRADQGACVDGCRAGRRLGHLWALDHVIRYRSSLSLSISPQRLTTAFIRGPGDHVPSGRIGSDGSSSGAEARQTHRSAHSVLQVWHMCRAHIRLRRQDGPALEHGQDLRANRPEYTRTQQAYVPQTLATQQRHAADIAIDTSFMIFAAFGLAFHIITRCARTSSPSPSLLILW